VTNDRPRLTVGRRRRTVAGAGALVVVLALAAGACAPKRLTLPAGPGTPVPDYRAPFDQASASCRGVRTLRATIALSGRASGQRMRGTLLAGMEAPDAVRLEGVAPFGAPVFILVAQRGSATLLLPRDERVLTGVSASDILEALAGVRVDPPTLRAMVSGCVVADPEPVGGRAYPNGWMAVDIGNGATAYLRQAQGQWRLVAGLIPGLEVQFGQFEGTLPREIRVFSRADSPSAVPVALTLALSDVSANVTLNPAAFRVDVPAGAVPITLDELREAGPLGERRR
jgi:hypothetical protein